MADLPPLDPRSRRAQLETRRSRLLTDRASFDSQWRDLADFIAPRRVRFTASDRNKGDRRTQYIVDSTARFAARTLQSGLHAGLTSPARPWMRLTTPDPDLADVPAVREWLHVVTERMLTVFLTSNLYNTLPIVYGDLGVFGTAAMSVLADRDELLRCYAYPVGSYALGLDARGRATTFVRDYELTVRQVVETFGVQGDGRTIDWSGISDTVRHLWEEGTYEAAVPITWLVEPNAGARRDRIGSRYLPWASCYWERGGDRILRESGFETFPIMAPRWDVTGEDTYGTDCPGMMALGDVRQLQAEQRTKGQAIQKMVNPPLQGPAQLRTQKTSLLPGDVTYLDVREGGQGLRTIHEVGLNLEHLTRDLAETQYRIQRAFYEDLFLMLARSDDARGSQPPTAREIDERHEEKLLALGPVLERTNDELLDPLIDRAFQLMTRAGLVPPAPEALQGVALKVEYISIMAQAQKLVGVVGQDRFLQTAAALAQTFPEVREKIDPFQVIDNYADMLGVDPRILRSTDDARAAIAAQRQQQQQAEAAAQAAQLARAGKDAAQTPMGGDTALSRLVTGIQGAAA